MSAGPIADYLRALERALHERGCHDPRMLDEAREHLADAADDGVGRGLAREEAEREAVERFGPPGLIAAQAPVGSRTMSRLTAALDTIVDHWRWLTAATAVAAVVAGTVSYYVVPASYRSESMIAVIPYPGASPFGFEMSRSSQERMHAITTTILSDARLDSRLKDFGLGTAQQVRRNISVEIALEQPDSGHAIGAFRVAFQSADPRLSQRVTERLTSLFIIENFEDQAKAPGIGDQFRVTQPPTLPTDPLRPGMAKMTVSGAFAGLALSVAALIWKNSRAA